MKTNDDIVVSIVCTAYNHEKYIREALDGFIMQKTDFAYEVLIHDDASTDKTPAIIKEYEKKYPDIIKAIYQKENQYSQGVKIGNTFLYPRAKGKYIALCEGDDYWIDPLKLQKQVNALNAHSELDVCAHSAKMLKGKQYIGEIKPSKQNIVFSPEEVILGGGGFVATNSLMFRKEALVTETSYNKILSLDYVVQIQGSLRGGMLYLNDCMSVYRRFAENSWTVRMNNIKELVEHNEKVKQMLSLLDKDTRCEYHTVISKKIKMIDFISMEAQGQYRSLLKSDYYDIFKTQSLKKKIKIIIKSIILKKCNKG